MPHHQHQARQAERDAARVDQFASNASRRAQPRRSRSPDPWWQSTASHQSSAARMQASAAALRDSAEIERRHEDEHGDHASADGETEDSGTDGPPST